MSAGGESLGGGRLVGCERVLEVEGEFLFSIVVTLSVSFPFFFSLGERRHERAREREGEREGRLSFAFSLAPEEAFFFLLFQESSSALICSFEGGLPTRSSI